MYRVTGMWRSCHRIDAASPATTRPWWLRALPPWTLPDELPATAAVDLHVFRRLERPCHDLPSCIVTPT
jgi:hypothetical protein